MEHGVCKQLTLATCVTLAIAFGASAQQNDKQFRTSELKMKLKGVTSFRSPIGFGGETKASPHQAKWDEIHYRAHHYGKILAQQNGLSGTAKSVPSVTALPVVAPDAGFSGFAGINGTEQAALEGFDLEPPDQGLCTDGNSILEVINLAAAVYSPKGKVLSEPVGLSSFFGTTATLSDPRCYYDPPTARWFWSITEVAIPSAVLLAVSLDSDPAGSYYLYSIDTSNDGALNLCPCFGDQPQLGADTNGIYLTTNAYSLFYLSNGEAQIYALSKFALVAGLSDAGQHLIPAAGPGDPYPFSLSPALSPDGQGSGLNGGTEYLMASDIDANEADEVVLWAITNTSSLGEFSDLRLSSVVVKTETYYEPPPATQKAGYTPLGKALGESEEGINTDDDRMSMPLNWADGNLWAAVNSAVEVDGNTVAGIAYFIVQPSWKHSALKGSVTTQGYVVAEGPSGAADSTIYPAFGVSDSGSGAMVFTLTGPDYFPSAAYVPVTLAKGAGTGIRLAGKGVAADDGFSGYAYFGGPGYGRWGDYSWAVAVGKDVWIATEYIGPRKRDFYTNWGTFIGAVPLP